MAEKSSVLKTDTYLQFSLYLINKAESSSNNFSGIS
jgi:hypothetical protein